MTFKDIFKSSFLTNITEFSITDILLAMLFACIVGLFVFWVYKKTFTGVMYSTGFALTLVGLTLVTTLVILAVTSNVVLSLGMVGALSIVRFRTAIKEPMEIVFLFWAIAAGIVIGAGMIVLFLRTPTSFLPEEDQGVFMTTAQLPSGSTMVNTSKVLGEITDYYLTKEQKNVASVFTVGGFGFSGQGQNNGLAFISLKPWSERIGEENSVTAIIRRAMMALSTINNAVVYPFNLPAVAELGTASGFDIRRWTD